MKLKSIFALLLVLCMVFTLCACGESTDGKKTDKETEEQAEAGENEDTKPKTAEYVVFVEDEDGDPVEGVELKFNKDTGDTTITTDEDGKAKLTCLVTDIVVTVEEVPEDYEEDSEEYEFDDEFEITITLEKA